MGFRIPRWHTSSMSAFPKTFNWQRNTYPECRLNTKRKPRVIIFLLAVASMRPVASHSHICDSLHNGRHPRLWATMNSSFHRLLPSAIWSQWWRKYHSVQETRQVVIDTWSILTHIVQIEIFINSIQTLNLLQKVRKIFLRLSFFGGGGGVETGLQYISLANLKLNVQTRLVSNSQSAGVRGK